MANHSTGLSLRGFSYHVELLLVNILVHKNTYRPNRPIRNYQFETSLSTQCSLSFVGEYTCFEHDNKLRITNPSICVHKPSKLANPYDSDSLECTGRGLATYVKESKHD